MISKAFLRQVRSLTKRKERDASQLFVAEGPKLVGELLAVWQPVSVVAVREWFAEWDGRLDNCVMRYIVTPDELSRISLQQHPQQVVAIFRQPDNRWDNRFAKENLCLALDGIQDPGNLGTICRVADWFGIEHIVCSPDTADIYNPKAVQATMGAIARVAVHYDSLPPLLQEAGTPVYGTFLQAESIYTQPLGHNGFIVMGNEGNGISALVEACVTRKLYIPNYPIGRNTTESLNVAIATSIVCAEFRRREPQ